MSLTVTVYKINEKYFPEGCERTITCSKVLSLKQNVTLKLPSGLLTCDEDEIEPVITEIIQLPDGEKWWILQQTPSFTERCTADTGTCCITQIDLDSEDPDNNQHNTFQITPTGVIWFVDKDGNSFALSRGIEGDPDEMAFFGNNAKVQGSPDLKYDDSAKQISIKGDIFSKGQKWLQRNTPIEVISYENAWFGIAYNNDIGRWIITSISDNGNGSLIYSDDNGNTWQRADPVTLPPANANIGAVAYGNFTFVAVEANTGRAWTSGDGLNWTNQDGVFAGGFSCRNLIFANGIFVALNQLGNTTGYTSPDGVTWTPITCQGGTWMDICWSEDLALFAACSLEGHIQTSPDAVTWTNRPLDGGTQWHAIEWGNGTFVVVGSSSSKIATSPDGVTWTNSPMPTFDQFINLAFGNGVFSTINVQAGGTWTSPDGVNWDFGEFLGNIYYGGLAFANGVFIAADTFGSGNIPRVALSSDGAQYDKIDTPNQLTVTPFPLRSAFGAGVFVCIQELANPPYDVFLVTADGVNFKTVDGNIGLGSRLVDIIFAQGKFVALSEAGDILTSYDGFVWEVLPNQVPGGVIWSALTFGKGIFVFCSLSGDDTSVSSDLATFQNQGFPFATQKVIFYNGLFIAVGFDPNNGYETMHSEDGQNWTAAGYGWNMPFFGIAAGNGVIVALTDHDAQDDQRIIRSTDGGLTWNGVFGGGTTLFKSVAFGAGLFVAVGLGNVYVSKDGNFWSVIVSPNNEWRNITFGNGIFLAITPEGTDNKAMTSGFMDASPDLSSQLPISKPIKIYPDNLQYHFKGTITQSGVNNPPTVIPLEEYDRDGGFGRPAFDYTGTGQYSWVNGGIVANRTVFLLERNINQADRDIQNLKIDGQIRIITYEAGIITDDLLVDTSFSLWVYDPALTS